MNEREQQIVREIIKDVFSRLGYGDDLETYIKEQDNRSCVSVRVNDAGLLIGRNGENLRATQHLLILLVSRRLNKSFLPGTFTLDINDYRAERERYLASLAKNIAQEVVSSRQSKELQPMPASDRRIIHITLTSVDGIKTQSVGEKRNRRVVIEPT